MPAPKRPDPNHPLAASAGEIEADIAAALKLEEPKEPPADPPPAEPAAKVVTDPAPTPTPPAPSPAPTPAPADDRMQQMMDTMMGRMEALNEENKQLRAVKDNHVFLETRVNELARENAELKARMEAGQITSGFQSELVDQQHFGEIYRGMQPTFKSINDQVASILARLTEIETGVKEAKAAPAVAIGKFRKEILDKTVRRGTPKFAEMLKNNKAFQDFLQETIPGSRVTRMDQVQSAWEENDDTYFGIVVADFEKRGNPQPVPSPDPPRTITEQQPKMPVKEPTITEEHLSAAFAQVLTGEMKREDYRKLDAAARRQGVSLPARN